MYKFSILDQTIAPAHIEHGSNVTYISQSINLHDFNFLLAFCIANISACFVVSVFVSFPATAGFTYVIRNIQRREHAWMWHDFKKHIRANYKKGVINGAVTLVLYYLLINAHGLYLGQYVFPSATLNTVFSVVMMLLIVLFTWSQFYVNTMIVTFDLKMRDIYKNAFLFAISSAPRNLLVSIICLILGFGVYVLFLAIPPLAILLAFLILYSLFGFITVFTIYPTIDKYMIAVAPNKKADTEGEI